MAELERLEIRDFRSYGSVELTPAAGLTAVVGRNGQGKTNLLEAVAFNASLRSFRGAPTEALVRVGAEAAVLRGTWRAEDREVLVEVELPRTGRQRAQVNRQRVARRSELVALLPVTVFSPDDLELVKGGPAMRRDLIDELLMVLHPRNEPLLGDLDKVLRQRNALLKQMGGRTSAEALTTLDVWDDRLARTGEAVTSARREALGALEPMIASAYAELAGRAVDVTIAYDSAWASTGLAAALAEARSTDVRRGVSTVGPHRDDVVIHLDAMASRTQASQGEQRSLALALRLAGHRLVADRTGTRPVLLLDDVFSELDPERSAALFGTLPAGQALLSTAGGLPPGAAPDLVVHVDAGCLTVAATPTVADR